MKPARFSRNGAVKALTAAVQASFLASTMLVSPLGVPPAAAANPSADLDQCANDPAPSPHTDGCATSATEWVNGNLGASKSVYLEGDSIPYRMRFDNLDTSSSHTVIIEWDTTKSGKHAIDYLTTWNRTVADSDPCLGVSGCSTSTTFAIPADPQVTGAGITPIAGNFTLFGGTITGVSAYSYPDGAGFAGDKSADIAITFDASVANPVLAWGGHIADRHDWGEGNAAVAIPGSPYHMRLIDLDGAGGNQDRSLSADAVIFPGSITIIKDATPNGSTSFSFTASPAPLANFSLVDDGTSANTRLFAGIIAFTTYTVAETVPAGWDFDGYSCSVTSANGGSTSDNGTSGVDIVLKEGENWTCTFSNSETPAPALSITKVATESGFDSVGDVIHYTITATNTGNVTLASVTVTDPNASGLDCTPANGSSLDPGDSMTCTASHTIVQADLDAGHYYNQACVDDGAGGAAEVCDDVDTPGTQSPALSITKVATESSFDSVGDVIHYTITATNTGNVTLHDVTVTDSQVSDLDCSPAVPVSDLAPGDSITCTASHTIVQADLEAGHFYNQACVDDGDGGAASACDDVDTPGTQSPALGITKVATEDSFSAVGDVIHYTITATNIGNVTLHDVVVTDSQVSDLVCDPTTPVTDLAPGDSITCTASHTITQVDLDAGSFFNEACVDDGEGGAPEACDDVTTDGQEDAELSIVKEVAEDGFTAIGQVLHYTIVATNTGNVTLHDVVVTDPNASNLVCDPALPVADLAPGDSITCTADHTITADDATAGFYDNEACVDDGDGPAAEACDDVHSPGQVVQGESNLPSLPNTASAPGSGSGPAGQSWLLVLGLGLLAAVVLAMTPRPRRRRE